MRLRPGVLAVHCGQPVLTVDTAFRGRVYPRAVVEREVAQLNRHSAGVTGVIGNPPDHLIRATRVSHQTKQHHVDPDGVLRCDVEILDTPAGRTAHAMLSAGVPLALQVMGRATVVEGVVQRDFTLDAINLDLTGRRT